MNCFPNHEAVENLRKKYPPGTLVELVHMGKDPYSRLKPGDRGVVSTSVCPKVSCVSSYHCSVFALCLLLLTQPISQKHRLMRIACIRITSNDSTERALSLLIVPLLV